MGLLVLCLAALAHSAPFPQADTGVTKDNFNFTNSYIQFFRVKDLIEHINLRKFKEFQEQATTEKDGNTQAEEEDTQITEIDLTEDAIINDQVTGNVDAPVSDVKAQETTTLEPAVVEDDEEVATVSTENIVDEKKLLITTTVAPAAAGDEEGEGYELTVDEYDSINEIDTGDDTFFVSKQTAEAAQKYGYKILLKKVGTEEIAVGKIKFSLPTVVEIESVEEPTSTSVKEEADVIEAVTEVIEIIDPTTIPAPQSTDVPATTTVVSESEVVTEEELEQEVPTTTVAVAVTEIPETYLPPPITAVVPTVDTIDEKTIVEGVMKIEEETVTAIDEIMNSMEEGEDDILFPECSAPLGEVKEMLSSLALNVANSTPILKEILATGESLKDITDLEALARGGAKLLTLLEPFLDTLLPATQVSECAGGDSVSMLMSLSGVATKLDLLANEEEDQDKANQLHQTATSLQLAAWVMAQLQKSVHTFYTPEGLCGEGKSSAVAILSSLSMAMSEYMPLLAMMGNEESVQDLAKTIETINNAKAEIASLEASSGLAELPGVDCGASFSEMGLALQELADFLHALPQ